MEAPVRQENWFAILDKGVSVASAFSELDKAVILVETQQRGSQDKEFQELLRFVEERIVRLHMAGDVEMAEESLKGYCLILSKYGLS